LFVMIMRMVISVGVIVRYSSGAHRDREKC
jgi:hypothetical protein